MSAIILFDGDCHFCDKSVQFIIQRDPRSRFQFASLQSDKGRELLLQYNIPDDTDSLVLIQNGKARLESTAALTISRQLKGFWKLTYFLILIPRPLRNAFYRWFASNRYKWFGKKDDTCPIPSPDVRKRFL
ncbi:thiol-disulfide oxidoreductase DCC family protein [Halobacillus kuroshimensis]|uniref:Thiol-disulfide oxidoreductase DCC family protein n=1 Tax=Halobacillus kuroshimensis TaxID=302481 RepID=A0ABS3DZR7_9BACI|nr:thiol-disulfide oxidoreductase DCC family protein [Halobacillus kuroshimensis]MBN8236806.1 thiol-disulfide oxidoreductase DCC family protein [Halobacillus kuroshimensis]